jgi:hypothetical protein
MIDLATIDATCIRHSNSAGTARDARISDPPLFETEWEDCFKYYYFYYSSEMFSEHS